MKSKTKQGKEFELDFKNSFPSHIWVYRIPDNATSFGGGNSSRFTSDSRYDYLCYDGLNNVKQLHAFELKSNEGTSISFCPYELSLSYEDAKNDLENYRQTIKGTQTTDQKEQIKLLKENYKALEKKCKLANIKYHQIKNLLDDTKYGIKSYLMLNFRKTNTTYALYIQDFYIFWTNTDKKSINQDDIKNLNHILIPQEPVGKSKHWKYDISIIL